MSKVLYEQDCRGCDHTIKRTFEVDKDFVNSEASRRIRCKNCRKTNWIADASEIL